MNFLQSHKTDCIYWNQISWYCALNIDAINISKIMGNQQLHVNTNYSIQKLSCSELNQTK